MTVDSPVPISFDALFGFIFPCNKRICGWSKLTKQGEIIQKRKTLRDDYFPEGEGHERLGLIKATRRKTRLLLSSLAGFGQPLKIVPRELGQSFPLARICIYFWHKSATIQALAAACGTDDLPKSFILLAI